MSPLDDQWYAVATSGSITTAPLAITLRDVAVVIWRNAAGALSGELSLEQGALVDARSDKASLEWRRRYRALVVGDSA